MAFRGCLQKVAVEEAVGTRDSNTLISGPKGCGCHRAVRTGGGHGPPDTVNQQYRNEQLP